MRIKISAVNELATYILLDGYYDRRDLILIWLKRQGISVYGKRTRYFKDSYDKLKKKMDEVWRDS